MEHREGNWKSGTYTTWDNMRQRCNNPNRQDYARYGATGVTYDKRWDFFENFLADMGERPEAIDAYSLERRDNSKGYSKDNCYWATAYQQAHNKSNNGLTETQVRQIKGLLRSIRKGVTFTKSDNLIAKLFGVKATNIKAIRLGRNWATIS